MSSYDWMNSWWDTWVKWVGQWGWKSPPHLMSVAATAQTKSEPSDEPLEGLTHRVLPGRAWSTFAMLHILSRLATVTKQKLAKNANPPQTKPWVVILLALLTLVVAEQVSFTVYVDVKAARSTPHHCNWQARAAASK